MSKPSSSAVLARHAGRFVALGGRLLVELNGQFAAKMDMGKLFETIGSPDKPALFERRRATVRRFLNIARGRDSDLVALVQRRGKPTPNGWLVWEA